MLSMLPALAFVLCGSMTGYFALLGLGRHGFGIRQFLDADTNDLAQEATEQNQDDDYQALISLGFKPIGRYREQFGWFGPALDEVAMVHCELPICCYLKVLPSSIAIVELLTDDANGRFIVTTTLDASDQASEDHDFLRQPRWGEKPELLFQDHVVALDAREQDGFLPMKVSDMSGFAKLRKRYFRHRKSWSAFNESLLLWSAASALVGLVIPAFITWTIYDFCYQGLGLSVHNAWTIFAVCSILFTFLLAVFSLRSASKRRNKRLAKRPFLQQSGSVVDQAWCQHCGESRAIERQKYLGPCPICKNGVNIGGNGYEDFQPFPHGKDCRGDAIGALNVCSFCHEPVFAEAQTRDEFFLLEEKEEALQRYVAEQTNWFSTRSHSPGSGRGHESLL